MSYKIRYETHYCEVIQEFIMQWDDIHCFHCDERRIYNKR